VNPTTLTSVFGSLLIAPGAMRLLHQFAMAMIVGFGPLFILCLIFEQTKDLFRKWLMYGIGTLFSIAMLYVVTSIVLYLTVNLAGALWSATLINSVTGQGGEGYSSQAIQQGGIGLLMTVLIISVPPMASMFFQGTMGGFLFQSAFSAGGARAAAMQQGLPPGAYGEGGGGGAPQASGAPTSYAPQASGAFSNSPSTGTYQPGASSAAQTDVVKPVQPTPSMGGTR
jgi:type IV secretion system protein VirB6